MHANERASGAPMRSGALIALVALVLVLAAACNPWAGPSPTTAGPTLLTTGVHGLVQAGPTCPVEQAGKSPCVRSLSGATILALDSARLEVGRAVSDTNGDYFLRLAPGTYAIVPQAVQGVMRTAAETTVTVPDGAPVQLNLQYDTGIR